MPGDTGPNGTQLALTDRVLDHLLVSDGDSMSAGALLRALDVPESVLQSAIRGLVAQGTVTTAGSSRKHPGLPLFVAVADDPGHNRRAWAARRMRTAPPKREARPRRRKVVAPRPMTEAENASAAMGGAALHAALDLTARGKHADRLVRTVLAMDDGTAEPRGFSTAELGGLLGATRMQMWDTMKHLRACGLACDDGSKNWSSHHLTHIGYAAIPAAVAYVNAPPVDLDPGAVRVMRLFCAVDSMDSAAASRILDVTVKWAGTSLLRLHRRGLLNRERRSDPPGKLYAYFINEEGRAVLPRVASPHNIKER